MSDSGATVRVRVRARAQQGFRRAGLYWPREWTETDLSEADAERVLAEPRLEVKLVKEPDPKAKDTRDVQPMPEPEAAPVVVDVERVARLEAREEAIAIAPEPPEDDEPRVPVSPAPQKRHQSRQR